MEQLYHRTNRRIMEMQERLATLENCHDNNTFEALNTQTSSDVNEILSDLDRLDSQVAREMGTRKMNVKMKADQLRYDLRHIQSALQSINNKRHWKIQREVERDQLLRRTFTTNSPREDLSITIDHHERTSNSIKNIDELIDSGNSILGSLREQGGVLKTVGTKVKSVFNTLGLSNTVMRMVERRSRQDRILMFGGMFASLTFMLLIYIYFL